MGKSRRSGGRRGITRRQFINAVAGAAGGLALPGCGNNDTGSVGAASLGEGLPDPKDAGFDHVIVVMMENRSFDHMLGWVPGADGVQAGVTLKDSTGASFSSYDLAPNFQGCQLADPDHTYEGGRTEINGGAMDGFLLTQPPGDTFPIGYYTADSVPFHKGCAENWTICDRYFSGILSLTTPNRIYMHAGQTDRMNNSVALSTLPTIWDRMLSVGKTCAYYYVDVSYTSFWGDAYRSFSKQYDTATLTADMASGNLADLTFIDNVGNTLNEGGGLSRDDHPTGDIRNGQAFLNDVYNAIRNSPKWDRTLVIVNYDEWGGFYDHVPPPFAPVTPEEAALGNDGRLGCRVPCIIIGPRAKRGHVEHMQFDPNSILNMLAWRFGFAPLGARAGSNNIARALDYANPPNLSAPAFDVPPGPFGGMCIPLRDLLHLAGLPEPATLPDIPLLPKPLQLQLPPIPGFDVPLHRLIEHEMELDALRNLGHAFGF
jgi:phospholipase C